MEERLEQEGCNGNNKEKNCQNREENDADLWGTFTVCYPIAEVPEEHCEDSDHHHLLRRMVSSASLESLTSGTSSASEERLNLLRCVASYNDRSKKDYFWDNEEGFIGNSSGTNVENVTRKQNNPLSKGKLRFEDDDEIKEHSPPVSRQTSTNSKQSFMPRRDSKVFKSPVCGDFKFDPTLEKSKTYLHGQSKSFSRANQYLTPARPGLRKLQVSYTHTNTDNNQSVIFYDLVKNAHKQNILISEKISNLERRLLMRRRDPVKNTTFYEHMRVKDPRKVAKKKTARTVADKQKERKDRIQETTDDMKTGYKPTFKTMKKFTAEDIERMREIRYLRLDSDL